MASPNYLFSISLFSSVLLQIILCSGSEREMFYAALLCEESHIGYVVRMIKTLNFWNFVSKSFEISEKCICIFI
jgi:hypothetical protein